MLAAATGFAAGTKTRVACIGNSITYGMTLEDPATQSYPAQLQKMLGDSYDVGRFGRSGATLIRRGHHPYTAHEQFRQALAFRPDIAVIHLGINDTDPRTWPNYCDDFVTDYVALIDSIRAVNPDVRILIARLSPINARHHRWRSGTHRWRLEAQNAIERVARITGAELIDFNAPLRDRQNLLPDGLHPNTEGSKLLARAAYSGITGDYGGLRLPAVWQSGMVVQRDRPLTLEGTADAGSHIKITLEKHTFNATANNRGQWKAMLPPLSAGGPYAITVTDGKRTIALTDILAGEVWIAAGQSNMEFQLHRAKGGREAVASSADPQLRIFDMKPIAPTNAYRWSDEIIAAMDSLGHYKPTTWQKLTPDNAADFSAVAYFFARNLRDSLNVPVGIISNAVGGSTTESWTDINVIEEEMPEAIVNWRGNDYLQLWAQDRANENTGREGNHRHPYEPGYLFATGIRPLGHLPVAGAIWYQGESNAHNTMLHESLFRQLVKSWRNQFGTGMPFHFVQLSSMDRPSWAIFRDSQRRLAREMEGVTMSVCSDYGDSLDVHPWHKAPVGHRLARQALRHNYGHTGLCASGPEPVRLTADADGRVTIEFANGNGLTTSDGRAPRTFEIAETDGNFLEATAVITDNNKITLYNMNIKKPRLVRYGWQPFTRANVINADSLPMSTFREEVSNSIDYDPEQGLEYGVSAPFAGMAEGLLITAGGCNFPTSDPFAPTAVKKFYKGVYAADPATLEWKRIGSLQRPMAYGSTTAAPQGGLLLIGGTDSEGPLSEVTLMNTDASGNVTFGSLPQLPVTFDNGAAATIGTKVYVAGGNQNGIPSRDLWVLDTSAPDKGWKKLRPMPGNPRTQPVMAASAGKLWLWGGFAGKHGKHEATLECDGLCYDPTTGKWTPLPAPADGLGNEISLGGGCAATLPSGRIAAAGGVNKDVFLEALRNQAPDYLSHPVEWYRFNPCVLTFDPASSVWTLCETTADAARAGAAMITDGKGAVYITGGELKPRIRTAETLKIDFQQ